MRPSKNRATRSTANFKERAVKTRTICDLVRDWKLTPKDFPWAVMVNENLFVGKWTVEKLTVGKDISEIHETSSLYYNTLFKDIYIETWYMYIIETEEHKVIPTKGPVTEL